MDDIFFEEAILIMKAIIKALRGVQVFKICENTSLNISTFIECKSL